MALYGSLDEVNLDAISKEITDNAVDIFIYDTSKDSDGGKWRKRTKKTSWYNETLNTSIRGSRREFPAVAVIVAESYKVTIYDGDDPDLPMWMEWTDCNLGGLKPITAIEAKNGIVVWTTDDTTNNGSALYEWNFIAETEYIFGWYNITIKTVGNPFLSRTSERSYVNVTYRGIIINSPLNDVAMTVLPNAPIDPTTRLPIPTIAVATDGGVSVIKDNGTVIDYTYQVSTNNSANNIYLSETGRLQYSSRSINSGYAYYFEYDNLSSSDVTSIPNVVLSVNQAGGSATRILPRGGINSDAITKYYTAIGCYPDSYTHYQGGLFLHKTTGDVKEADGSPNSNFMGLHIRSDYNTGWMYGDIKGAFLSDTDTTNANADTLNSVNTFDGTFATSTGWTTNSDWTISGGVASCSGANAGRFMYPSTDRWAIGLSIVVEVTVTAYTSGTLDVSYGTGAATAGTSMTATGTYKFVNIVGGNDLIYFRSESFIGSIDNVKIYYAESDRSVNNKGLIPYGTITKSTVASGADLVAYSGWSSSNYMKQPNNSDLNFGTGDFSIVLWMKNGASGHDYALSIGTENTTNNPRLGIRGSTSYTIGYNQNGGLRIDSGVYTSGQWQQVCVTRSAGLISLYVDGILTGTTTHAVDHTFSSNHELILGHWPTNKTYAFGGSLALLRISKSAPSAGQVKKMYEDEKFLFQENTKCTLYGSSDAVTALAYDDKTNLLHVGTSSGRSDFRGLRRINNTTTGITTAISASNKLIAEQ